MSELNYRCPKCGQDERFYFDWVEVFCPFDKGFVFDEDGIDFNGKGFQWDVHDGARFECPECGYKGSAIVFAKEEA